MFVPKFNALETGNKEGEVGSEEEIHDEFFGSEESGEGEIEEKKNLFWRIYRKVFKIKTREEIARIKDEQERIRESRRNFIKKAAVATGGAIVGGTVVGAGIKYAYDRYSEKEQEKENPREAVLTPEQINENFKNVVAAYLSIKRTEFKDVTPENITDPENREALGFVFGIFYRYLDLTVVEKQISYDKARQEAIDEGVYVPSDKGERFLLASDLENSDSVVFGGKEYVIHTEDSPWSSIYERYDNNEMDNWDVDQISNLLDTSNKDENTIEIRHKLNQAFDFIVNMQDAFYSAAQSRGIKSDGRFGPGSLRIANLAMNTIANNPDLKDEYLRAITGSQDENSEPVQLFENTVFPTDPREFRRLAMVGNPEKTLDLFRKIKIEFPKGKLEAKDQERLEKYREAFDGIDFPRESAFSVEKAMEAEKRMQDIIMFEKNRIREEFVENRSEMIHQARLLFVASYDFITNQWAGTETSNNAGSDMARFPCEPGKVADCATGPYTILKTLMPYLETRGFSLMNATGRDQLIHYAQRSGGEFVRGEAIEFGEGYEDNELFVGLGVHTTGSQGHTFLVGRDLTTGMVGVRDTGEQNYPFVPLIQTTEGPPDTPKKWYGYTKLTTDAAMAKWIDSDQRYQPRTTFY